MITLQRMMEYIFNGLPFVCYYADDAWVLSQNWEEHKSHMIEMLECWQKDEWQLARSKQDHSHLKIPLIRDQPMTGSVK